MHLLMIFVFCTRTSAASLPNSVQQSNRQKDSPFTTKELVRGQTPRGSRLSVLGDCSVMECLMTNSEGGVAILVATLHMYA
jgi:hypothetical protein